MYEFIKDINDNVKLAFSDGMVFIAKEITPDDLPVYRKIAGIKNKNIVSVKEITCIDGRFYVIRDFIQGVTLDRYIELNGLMDDKMVKNVILDVCNGLRAVHGLGIVHRDINPSNIIIDGDGKAVIIDFGISRIEKEGMSRDTQILGTHGYAAPEQYGFTQTDNRADIYAVGVLMNYLKTGMMPNEKLENGYYKKIIQRCIEIDSDERYQDVEAVMAALGRKPKLKDLNLTLPGFRKKIWWHEVIAVSYAFFVLIIYLAILPDINGWIHILFNIFEIAFMFVLPVPIAADWTEWVERLTDNKFESRASKNIFLGCCAAVPVFISCILMIVEQYIK